MKALTPLREKVLNQQKQKVSSLASVPRTRGLVACQSPDDSWSQELVNQWVPPGGHIHKDFSNGSWRITWLFGNISRSFATCGVHGSAIACLRNAWESHTACAGLPCDVPGVILGNVAPVAFPDHGAPGPEAQPKANRSRRAASAKDEPGPQTSLPAGRGRGRGGKTSRRKGRGRLASEDLSGAPTADLTLCRHQLKLLLHLLCRAAPMAVRAEVLHHRAPAWADLMKSAILTNSICIALVTFLPTMLTHLICSNCLKTAYLP